MKKNFIFLMIILLISSFVSAQTKGLRKSLFDLNLGLGFNTLADTPRGSEVKEDSYSMLSLGTLFGVSYSLNDMTTYKISNGIVKVEKKGTGSDKYLPAVYAFPSISLFGKPGKSLSMIVPVNLNPSSELAIGVGFSYGFNTFKNSAEVGIALVSIWSDRVTLSDAQSTSLNKQEVLPPDESTTFSKSKSISIGLGIYVVPLFK